MEEKKFKVTAPKKGETVEIVGLDEVIFQAIDSERMIAEYEKFAEDVALACAMPEIPRYSLAIEDKPEIIGHAEDILHTLLVRYRKMTAWFRANKIDVESVVGGDNNGIKS